MKIEHIAVYVKDLEISRRFYEKYFHGKCGERYNNSKGFSSYFLSFSDGARLEIMQAPYAGNEISQPALGYAHIAFSAGGKNEVDMLTERLSEDGYRVVGQPRITGDGYYESVISDPDGNLIEITI